ncbi:MAG: phosphopentomutase [Candidatus Zixiibacteriota bacterium]
MPIARVVLIVLDACGIGALPDAHLFGDQGAATIPHVANAVGGLQMPHCQRMGLGNITQIKGVPHADSPLASYGRMAEQSPGKDSTTGHWEMAGVILKEPFPLFPQGFPHDIVAEFERRAGVMTIGNCAASGTEIIEQLGEEHQLSGAIILYTSADSVFQLAAHEETIPLPRLYEICRIARDLLTGPFEVGRVIARPFAGKPGSYVRTAGRKDFSRTPPRDTLLDLLTNEGHKVLSIGKIYDLFAGRGINTVIKTSNNNEVMSEITRAVKEDREHQLIFANLVDFDQLWGHRNDEVSFGRALVAFDLQLGELLAVLHNDDLLVLTADHGCDPTIKSSTDHTREFVPLLAYGKTTRQGADLGTRSAFADLGSTIADIFDLPEVLDGTSFLSQLTGSKGEQNG